VRLFSAVRIPEALLVELAAAIEGGPLPPSPHEMRNQIGAFGRQDIPRRDGNGNDRAHEGLHR
jgi:hypothetical protein